MKKIFFLTATLCGFLFTSIAMAQPLTSTAEVDIAFSVGSTPNMSIIPVIMRTGNGNILNVHNNLSQPISLQQGGSTTIPDAFNIDYNDSSNPNLDDSLIFGFSGTYEDDYGNHTPFSYLSPVQSISNGQWSGLFWPADGWVYCKITTSNLAINHFLITFDCDYGQYPSIR